MKTMVVLQKHDDGSIYCREITELGMEVMTSPLEDDPGYWDCGGTVLLTEIEEILDRDI